MFSCGIDETQALAKTPDVIQIRFGMFWHHGGYRNMDHLAKQCATPCGKHTTILKPSIASERRYSPVAVISHEGRILHRSQEGCQIGFALTNAWLVAVKDHVSGLSQANSVSPLLSDASNAALWAEVARRRSVVEQAQQELDRHREHHGC
jgi:hypothetical protein